MNTTKFTVVSTEEGTTILQFISEKLAISKKKAKALLDSRGVFINRKRTWMAKHKLKNDDYIEILTNIKTQSNDEKVEILYEDTSYIIANKRPGLLANGDNSVESALRETLNMPTILSVHRLDKDTSGCLLFAKDRSILERTIPLFKEHQIEKTYHVIVSGRVEELQQTIRQTIDGQQAVTSIKRLDANREASHISVRIKTGRTHQIRKHLAAKQHYVIGDRHYGTGRKTTDKAMKVERQMLHASSLKFDHPQSGKTIKARAPLPQDFRQCLKLYKLT